MELQDWITCQAVTAKIERNELRLQNRRLYYVIFVISTFAAVSLPAMLYFGYWLAGQHQLQLEMLQQLHNLLAA